MPRDLWKDALDSLNEKDRKNIDYGRLDKRAVLEDVLATVLDARAESDRRKWSFRWKGKEKIIIRDVLEKIVKWIESVIAAGDVAIQFDPVHAALPWAAIKFLLRLPINEIQVRGPILLGIEQVAKTITRCSIVERLYTGGSQQDLQQELSSSLVELYATILRYLIQAKKYFERSMAKTIVQSMVPASIRGVDNLLEEIQRKETLVTAMRELFDVEQQRSLQSFAQSEQTALGTIIQATSGLKVSMHDHAYRTRTSLSNLLKTIDDPLQQMVTNVSNLVEISEKDRRRRVLQWLCTTPYRSNLKTVLQDIIPGSGLWLLERPEFAQWRDASYSAVLWLHGIPGCGKSKLIARVVEQLQSQVPRDSTAIVPLAFFFCARNTAEPLRSQPAEILRAVVKQLGTTEQMHLVHATILKAFEDQEAESDIDGASLSQFNAGEATKMILSLTDDNPAIIIVDALDECNPDLRYQLLEAFENLVSQSKNVVKVLVSSRDDIDILLRLNDCPNITIDARDNAGDIKMYTHIEVRRAIEQRRLLHGQVSSELEELINHELFTRAQGMFRWVALSLQNLCDPRRMKLEADVRDAIGKLPMTLAALYEIIFDEIIQTERNGRLVAIKTLRWLLCALAPISTSDIILAVSSELGSIKLDEVKLLGLLCNLVVRDMSGPRQIYRFAHLSVREYLETRPEFSPGLNHETTFESCSKMWSPHSLLSTSVTSFKAYASTFWPLHYAFSEDQDHAQELIGDLMFREDLDWAKNWTSYLKSRKNDTEYSEHVSEMHVERLRLASNASIVPALHLSSLFGFLSLLKRLKAKGFDEWNMVNDRGLTPLYLAIRARQPEVISYLLSQESLDASIIDQSGTFPLLAAVVMKDTDTLKKLMARREVDLAQKHPKTQQSALAVAITAGFRDIVELLLARQSEQKLVQNRHGRIPLHLVVESGANDFIPLLLEDLVEEQLSIEDHYGNTAPVRAIQLENHEAIVHLEVLLPLRSSWIQGNQRISTSREALPNGLLELVSSIVQNAELSLSDKAGSIQKQPAARLDSRPIQAPVPSEMRLKSILQSSKRDVPFFAYATPSIRRALLFKIFEYSGSDTLMSKGSGLRDLKPRILDFLDKLGDESFTTESSRCITRVLKILAGFSDNTDSFLQSTLDRRQWVIILCLLVLEYRIEDEVNDLAQLLHDAELSNYDLLVDLLLRHFRGPRVQEALVQSIIKSHATVHAATVHAATVHAATVRARVTKKILSRPEVDVNWKSDTVGPALIVAIQCDRKEIVDQLLQRPDLDVNISWRYGLTPLMLACILESPRIVKIILRRPDVDVNKQNHWGATALIESINLRTLRRDIKFLKHLEGSMDEVQLDLTRYFTLPRYYRIPPSSRISKLLLTRSDVNLKIKDRAGYSVRDLLVRPSHRFSSLTRSLSGSLLTNKQIRCFSGLHVSTAGLPVGYHFSLTIEAMHLEVWSNNAHALSELVANAWTGRPWQTIRSLVEAKLMPFGAANEAIVPATVGGALHSWMKRLLFCFRRPWASHLPDEGAKDDLSLHSVMQGSTVSRSYSLKSHTGTLLLSPYDDEYPFSDG